MISQLGIKKLHQVLTIFAYLVDNSSHEYLQ